jgi:hypothetical protein
VKEIRVLLHDLWIIREYERHDGRSIGVRKLVKAYTIEQLDEKQHSCLKGFEINRLSLQAALSLVSPLFTPWHQFPLNCWKTSARTPELVNT